MCWPPPPSSVPSLVVVDDVQWIDDPSASAIVFAARRLEHDRVGFLLAYRDSDVTELPDLPRLRLHGLGAKAIVQLLATRDFQLSSAQVASLVRLSGGNPLALVDLPDLMTGERLVELGSGRYRSARCWRTPMGRRLTDCPKALDVRSL